MSRVLDKSFPADENPRFESVFLCNNLNNDKSSFLCLRVCEVRQLKPAENRRNTDRLAIALENELFDISSRRIAHFLCDSLEHRTAKNSEIYR